MNSFAALDLIGAHAWRRAAFTTYALSLSFFEAVVLESLVRGGGREAVIFADIDGVRAALGEQGARRAGRDYEVEPIAVERGVFHPKVTALTSDTEAHLLVGSGNLTFGGWGGNVEVVEHLHPAFAGDAFADAAGFFEELATANGLRHGATDRFSAIADDLRRAGQGGAGNGDIRLFHSLGAPIIDQLADVVDGLGGARRLVIASPFWDGGRALDRLCARLGLDGAYVHVHGIGVVHGVPGLNWPVGALRDVRPMILDALDQDKKPRALHAKVFEVICPRGRVVMSGSANATTAALGEFRNVEASVVRIQREPQVGWSFTPTAAPNISGSAEDDAEDRNDLGVLRAALQADNITGQVLKPPMSGAARILQVTGRGYEPIGSAILNADGSFEIAAPGLEAQSWRGERLVLRVEGSGGAAAEGFISITAFKEISRRAGSLATRLFSLLAGTETPADVALIMSWFHEDPRRLADDDLGAGWKSSGSPEDKNATVSIDSLRAGVLRNPIQQSGQGGGGPSWERFLSYLFSALRQRRGPFPGTNSAAVGDDEDDDENLNKRRKSDPYLAQALGYFEKLFDRLLEDHNLPKNLATALTLAEYAADRLSPEYHQAKSWLERLMYALMKHGVPVGLAAESAMVVLLLHETEPDGGKSDKRARRRLLHLGMTPDSDSLDVGALPGLRAVLSPHLDAEGGWSRLGAVRTNAEQVRAYVLAMRAKTPGGGYTELMGTPEWPTLQEAITSDRARDRVRILAQGQEYCPVCSSLLPASEARRLLNESVATAVNCCGRVLVCEAF